MSETGHSVRLASWPDDQENIKSVRRQVFIIEQHVPEELEWDGLDEEAIHIIAVDNKNKIVGTARLLPTGQIGRMAVLPNERNKGIGSDMLRLLLNYSSENFTRQIFLNAQLQAISFYEQHGFVQTGEIFDDANIPHCKMVHNPER